MRLSKLRWTGITITLSLLAVFVTVVSTPTQRPGPELSGLLPATPPSLTFAPTSSASASASADPVPSTTPSVDVGPTATANNGPASTPTSAGPPCSIAPAPSCPVKYTIEPPRIFISNGPSGTCEGAIVTARTTLFISYPRSGGAAVTYSFTFNGIADAATTRDFPSGASELIGVHSLPTSTGQLTVKVVSTDPAPTSAQSTIQLACAPPA